MSRPIDRPLDQPSSQTSDQTDSALCPDPGYDVAPGFDLAPVERLFCELVAIDSPSLGERRMADRVRAELERLGFSVDEDETSGANDGMVTSMTASGRARHVLPGMVPSELRHIRLRHTGSTAGNLFATLPGTGEPLLFVTHLDTVQPAHGKRAQVHPDGRITSSGDTVLGADCLGGVAAVVAAVENLEARGVAHRPVELCCMVAEEIGNGGSGQLKKYVTESVNDFLAPIRERRVELMGDMDYVKDILREGNRRANEIANQTLEEVREAMGMVY